MKRRIWLQFVFRKSFRAFPLPPPSKALDNFTENGRFRCFRKKSPSPHKRQKIDVSHRFEHFVFFPQKPVYPASRRTRYPTLFQIFTKNPDVPPRHRFPRSSLPFSASCSRLKPVGRTIISRLLRKFLISRTAGYSAETAKIAIPKRRLSSSKRRAVDCSGSMLAHTADIGIQYIQLQDIWSLIYVSALFFLCPSQRKWIQKGVIICFVFCS